MTLSVYKFKTSSSLNTQEVQDRLNVRAVERDEMKSSNHNSHNIFREFSFNVTFSPLKKHFTRVKGNLKRMRLCVREYMPNCW